MLGFDARAARLLAPGDHLTFPEAPGLRLVATASRRSWVYRFKSPVDDRMRQVKIGEWPAVSPAAAGAAWERLRAVRATGVDPAAEKRSQRAARARAGAVLTVADLCDAYLGAYEGTVAPRTYRDAERILTTGAAPIAARPAASITRADAFDLIHARRDRPVIAQRLRMALGAAWDHGLDAGRLPPETPNWWRLVLRGKLRSQGRRVQGQRTGVAKRVLAEAEVAALLRWLPNFSRDVADVLTLYLWTCARGGEIAAMERGEITHEPTGVWWTVPKAKLKMRRNDMLVDFRVPLVGRALAIVTRRLEAHAGRYLFPSAYTGEHLQQTAVAAAVRRHMPYCRDNPERVRPRLPVTHWAPHDLRRTGRTMLAALGCPNEVAEAILGHVQPGVQGVYNRHGYDAERRVWLTRLADRLEAIAAG